MNKLLLQVTCVASHSREISLLWTEFVQQFNCGPVVEKYSDPLLKYHAVKTDYFFTSKSPEVKIQFKK